MHRARVLLLELHCSRSPHDLLGHDTTTLGCIEQKKCMLGIHTCSLAKPADTGVQRKFMHLALNVHAKRIP